MQTKTVTLKGKYVVEYNRGGDLDELTQERLFNIVESKVKARKLKFKYSDIYDVYDWFGEISFGWKLKNIIKNFTDLYDEIDFSKTLIKFKPKESSRYGIADYCHLPKVCGEIVDYIWYNKDKDQFFFSYHFNLHGKGWLQESITGLVQDDLDIKFLKRFMGEQEINGEKCFINKIFFRTDTRGISGPDEGISLGGTFPGVNRSWHDFALTNEKLLWVDSGCYNGQYFDFFKSIITEFKDRELCKKPKYMIKWVKNDNRYGNDYELQDAKGKVIINNSREWQDSKLKEKCAKTHEKLRF